MGISGALPDGTPIALGSATSRQRINLTNLRLAAAYRVPTRDGRFYAEPSFDVDVGYLRSGRVEETGLGDYGMALGKTGQWMLSASPSLEVGGTLAAGAGTIFAPYLRGGVTVFGSDAMRIDSRFSGAPASAYGFGNYFGFDQVVGRISTGVVIETRDDHLRFELGYDGMFGDNSSSHMARASVRMRF